LSSKSGTRSQRHVFHGSREEIKHSAAEAALKMLREYLQELDSSKNILEEKHVVTCFLESQKKILILRRSENVGTYQGRWAGVSGYIESGPDEQALTEIKEETGLDKEDIRLVRKGIPLEVVDERLGRRWIVHPYLFHVSHRNKIKIDWEHQEMKWIDSKDIVKYETVPMLRETLERIYEI
jgi:8-oxo-dGTP pyrophosphatase MutT (NUDIX family)